MRPDRDWLRSVRDALLDFEHSGHRLTLIDLTATLPPGVPPEILDVNPQFAEVPYCFGMLEGRGVEEHWQRHPRKPSICRVVGHSVTMAN